MEPRPGLPNFWVTSIAKALSGDQPCLLSPWLAGRFKFDEEPESAQMAKWKADHAAMLRDEAQRLAEEGWSVKQEAFFRVDGQHAIISGKADIIARKKDCRPRIIDCKSGRPRQSDTTQVLIEMVLIPMFYKSPTMQFEGDVIYQSLNSIVLSPSDAEAIRPKLFALLKQLGTMARPAPIPGRDACQFCKVPDAECGQRYRDEEETVTTLEF